MNDSYIRPGIRRVGWQRCQALPTAARLSARRYGDVPMAITFNKIETLGIPTLEITSKDLAGGPYYSVKLKFRSPERLPNDCNPVAFAAEDNSGLTWLIGTNTRPFCQVEESRNTGEPGQEDAGWTYEVTLVSVVFPATITGHRID